MKLRSFPSSICSVLICAVVTAVSAPGMAAPPAMAEGTTTMIIQRDVATGLQYYIYSAANSGVSMIPFPIGAAGAVFELWLKGSPPDKAIYFADSKVVNAYSPSGGFTIQTEDPWIVGSESSGFSYIKRTRADKGYTYHLTVNGLNAASGAPLSAKEMRLDRYGMNYFLTDHINVVSGDTERGPYSGVNWPDASPANALPFAIENFTVPANGIYTQTVAYNGLTATDPTKACGEEQLILTRYADFNPDGSVLVAATEIKKATVQVWPVSSVEIMGLIAGETVSQNLVSDLVVTDVIPQVGARYKDLYPDSRTYCQVYPGPPVLGTVGTRLPGSEEHVGEYYHNEYYIEKEVSPVPPYTNPATIPKNSEIHYVDLNAYCKSNGQWTLEVITETPFNSRAPERLLYITFTVNKGAAIRGQITTGR